jgi:hypothetical protein
MDEIREVKVTDTHIQHFECGCTTTVKKTTLEDPAPTMCAAHHGFLVGEETIKEYAAGTPVIGLPYRWRGQFPAPKIME